MIKDGAGVEDAIPAPKTETGAPWRVHGTASWRRPVRPTRIPCPSQSVGSDVSGLWLSAYGGTDFSFPGHRPSELAALLEKAAAALGAL